jgi:hypothetical protein
LSAARSVRSGTRGRCLVCDDPDVVTPCRASSLRLLQLAVGQVRSLGALAEVPAWPPAGELTDPTGHLRKYDHRAGWIRDGRNYCHSGDTTNYGIPCRWPTRLRCRRQPPPPMFHLGVRMIANPVPREVPRGGGPPIGTRLRRRRPTSTIPGAVLTARVTNPQISANRRPGQWAGQHRYVPTGARGSPAWT